MEAKELRFDVEGVPLDLNALKEEYGIRTDLTRQVRVEGLDGRASRLLKVDNTDFNVYLIETPHILRYLSHPHIFGDSLEVLLSENSSLLAKVLDRFSLQRFGKLISFDELTDKLGLHLPTLDQLRSIGDVVAVAVSPISADMESMEAEVRDRGGRLRVIFLLGPMSEEEVESLGDTANSLGVDIIFLAFALLGRKDSNGYSVAYGADTGLLRRGVLRGLGGVIDALTLCRMLRDYPPGIDISGIRGRLEPNLDYLRSILDDLMLSLEMPIYDPWQVEIIEREVKSLRRQLIRYEERLDG